MKIPSLRTNREQYTQKEKRKCCKTSKFTAIIYPNHRILNTSSV